MANMKDIKNRIKSVSSTMQITKAMELVASSKLKKARNRAENAKPYFDTITQAMHSAMSTNKNSIWTKSRDIKNTTHIVIAGDRGLAGGYNSNVLKLAKANINGENNIITIGKKASDFFKKASDKFLDISENLTYADAGDVGKIALDNFVSGATDEVYLYYTELVSPLLQEAKVMKLLPLAQKETKEDIGTLGTLAEYDPSPESVLSSIIPMYLSGVIYGAITESFASEQAARRIAMENATDNASDMIDNLSLIYNRARQGAITQEISEIVAGASSSNNN